MFFIYFSLEFTEGKFVFCPNTNLWNHVRISEILLIIFRLQLHIHCLPHHQCNGPLANLLNVTVNWFVLAVTRLPGKSYISRFIFASSLDIIFAHKESLQLFAVGKHNFCIYLKKFNTRFLLYLTRKPTHPQNIWFYPHSFLAIPSAKLFLKLFEIWDTSVSFRVSRLGESFVPYSQTYKGHILFM